MIVNNFTYFAHLYIWLFVLHISILFIYLIFYDFCQCFFVVQNVGRNKIFRETLLRAALWQIECDCLSLIPFIYSSDLSFTWIIFCKVLTITKVKQKNNDVLTLTLFSNCSSFQAVLFLSNYKNSQKRCWGSGSSWHNYQNFCLIRSNPAKSWTCFYQLDLQQRRREQRCLLCCAIMGK